MPDLKSMANTVGHVNAEDSGYSGQTMVDIVRRESLHEVVAEKYLCWQIGERQVFGYNTDDQHLLNFMPQLRRLYTRILANDEPPAEPAFVRWAKRPGYRLTTLGREVLDACKYFAVQDDEGRNWQQVYSHHRFHPVFAVMLRAVMRWWQPISRWWEPNRSLLEKEPEGETVQQLFQLVSFVRRVCRTQAFQNLLHDHERKAEDNFRSGRDYVIALFARHSRLLILRIDLYFRPDAKGWGYSSAADRAVSNYLRALRLGSIVPGSLGFIIKRENGISRGMHYHLMAILDGHQHRCAYHLTRLMGEAWVKRVGFEKGSYFNCYAHKDRYRYNGLGVIHLSDKEKLLGLRVALWYISKQDSELRVSDAKVKNFWRGLMPKNAGRQGAPRKGGDNMLLVQRLLGGSRSKYPQGFEPQKRSTPERHQAGARKNTSSAVDGRQAVSTH